MAARSAAQGIFAKALLADAEYVDYSELSELSEGDVR